ncbi:predicted protein [Naegleria gruberi]|uniref:Predicted protein n=1 Tax=Naegleria gruberi TaxID=5762 RepID=D2W0R8_NAEGR|nr:uncharacterized protein NAEGRDRAFT_74956 [Naegleria gruberi]EFC37338.1 predicted protein [Naegleria gruberi]|eukprot:XP_002670082.1 predicted protein [Naegleria gruberi strain NEG-M]
MSQDDSSSLSQVVVNLQDFIMKENNDFSLLDSWLKTKFRSSSSVPFSLRMNSLPPIIVKNIDDERGESCYDVVISYEHNYIIMGGMNSIHVFDYTTKKHVKSIKLDVEVHEMEIDKNGLNLYLTGLWETNYAYRVAKYDLVKLLNGEEGSCLWVCAENLLQNLWGIGLFECQDETFVYVMDYGSGLMVFDSRTGQRVHHKVPTVANGYGVAFTPENEMIITSAHPHASPVEIYTFDEKKEQWNLKKNCLRIESDSTPYGVFYEVPTQRIYVTDTVGKSITVFDMHTLTRVFRHEFPSNMPQYYGIMIDRKTGILYLPDVTGQLLCFD